MRFDIGRHGDPLERRLAALIESRLPAYGRLWSEYIGNDGHSHLPSPKAGTPAEQALRREVSARTYTSLEAIGGASRLVDQSKSLKIRKLSTPDGVDDYIDAVNILIGFFAQVGRLRDNMEELGNTFRDPELSRPLNEYYQRRNVVLHEAKIPVWIVDQVMAIAVPEGTTPNRKHWSSTRSWTDANDLDYESLEDLVAGILNEVLTHLDNALSRLYSNHLKSALAGVAVELAAWQGESASAQSVTASMTFLDLGPSFVSASANVPILPSGSATGNAYSLTKQDVARSKFDVIDKKSKKDTRSEKSTKDTKSGKRRK